MGRVLTLLDPHCNAIADPDRDRRLMPPPKMPASSLPTSKLSAFSESTKLHTKAIHGDSCWVCGTTPAHVYHVIAQEDRQVSEKQMTLQLLREYDNNTLKGPLWVDYGLVDWPISSHLNAIPLCASCHVNFDHHLDPGFSFIPTDIQYFIEFELEDRRRREEAEREGKDGKELLRRVPSPTLYKQHQIEKGQVGADANGGLYRPVFLVHYLHKGFLSFDEVRSRFSKARPWHGAPLASFRRAFLMLGNGRLGMLEKHERFQLLRLHSLYFLEEDYLDTFVQYYTLATKTDSEKRKQSDNKWNEEPPGKRRRTAQRFDDDSLDTTYCPILQRQVHAAWILGPNASTEDAVRRYAPILSNGKPSGASLCAT